MTTKSGHVSRHVVPCVRHGERTSVFRIFRQTETGMTRKDASLATNRCAGIEVVLSTTGPRNFLFLKPEIDDAGNSSKPRLTGPREGVACLLQAAS